jgi:hypothetical protein
LSSGQENSKIIIESISKYIIRQAVKMELT